MTTNLPAFLEQHPDTESLLCLYHYAWQQEYGDDFVMDVADSKDDATKRIAFYRSHGYTLVDENRFGQGNTVEGIVQCYRTIEDPN